MKSPETGSGRPCLAVLLFTTLAACGGATAVGPNNRDEDAATQDAAGHLEAGATLPPDDGGVPLGDGALDSGDGAVPCQAGRTACNGACVDLSSNQDSCGACGKACQPMERCQAGACVFLGCDPELIECSGICETATTLQHCGGCQPCGGGQVCSLEKCAPTCVHGLSSCSGGCADLTTDHENCGACGTGCTPTQSCVNGACTSACPAGFQTCVAGCVNLERDRLNCGACGNACLPGEACASGVCSVPQ